MFSCVSICCASWLICVSWFWICSPDWPTRDTSSPLLRTCVHSVAAPVAVPAWAGAVLPTAKAMAARPASSLFVVEQRCGIVNPSRLKPVDWPFAAMFGMERANAFQIFLAGGADEAQRQGPECHVEQPPAFRRDDIIFPLRHCVRDDLDLTFVEADPLVELARS